jgi:hypothetical protein
MNDIFTPPSTPPVNPSPAAPVRVAAPDPSTRPVVQSNPALSSPQERWQADRDSVAKNDPWQQSPEKVMMVKDPVTGEITARARDGSTGDPANPLRRRSTAASSAWARWSSTRKMSVRS